MSDVVKEIKPFLLPIVSHICENGEPYTTWKNKHWAQEARKQEENKLNSKEAAVRRVAMDRLIDLHDEYGLTSPVIEKIIEEKYIQEAQRQSRGYSMRF